MSEKAKDIIENPTHTIYLSVTSIWEMAIKVSFGKLKTPSPFNSFIAEQLRVNNFSLLKIETEHAVLVSELVFHHRDPFDRLLIAQAKHEGLTIIGRDMIFREYGINIQW